MLSKLRLRTRLFLAFGLMAGFCLLAGLLNLWSVRQLNSKLDEIVRNDIPELRASLEADQAHDAARSGIYRAIIGHSRGDMKEVAEGQKEFSKSIEELKKAMVVMKERTSVAEIVEAVKTAEVTVAEYAKAGERFGGLLQAGAKPADSIAAQTEFEGYFQALVVKMEKLSDSIQKDVGTTVTESQQVQKRSITLAVASTALALFVAIALALMLDRQISHPLSQAVASLESASLQVSGASTQITSNGQSLAESTSEQAASLEETSASLEEISAMTKRNAENASNSRALSQQARESASSGLDRISTMGRTLTSAKTAVGEMESAVSEMQSSSQEIAKIIKTIDEIAFQTNLLALNAAVEAARAGEAGAGFAVVADEVRSLAQRSAQAAKDTSEKIEAAIRRSEFGGVASSKVVQSLGEVETNAASIGQVFQGIVRQITSLDEVINQIASASQEQSSGITEVNMAVTQMDKVTQTNAASAQENAAAAHELNRQAVTLRELISRLHVMVAGTGEPSAGAGAAAVPTASAVSQPQAKLPAPLAPKSGNGRRDTGRTAAAAKIPFPEFPAEPAAGMNGHGHNGHGANGHGANGHGTNGHATSGANGSGHGGGMHPVSRLPGIPGGFRDF